MRNNVIDIYYYICKEIHCIHDKAQIQARNISNS